MKLFPNFIRHHLITHTLLCGLIIELKTNQHRSISTGSNLFFILESYCVSEDDSRWVPMCNHALNKRGSHSKDALLGMEECQSPFGIYELKIPIDNKLACDTNRITTTNCKDLDVGSCFSHTKDIRKLPTFALLYFITSKYVYIISGKRSNSDRLTRRVLATASL